MTYKDTICDANNLYKAYLASIKGSKWKESTQKFMINYLRYLVALQDDLVNETLKNGPTQEFSLSERGRVRPITSIPIRDRIVRHVLCDDILLPAIKQHVIYDNGASLKGRGVDFQRKRFEVHLRKYYRKHGNKGYILFGDFSKFYDNVIHDVAKKQLLDLFEGDEYLDWLFSLIFDGFKIDVSFVPDAEYDSYVRSIYDKLEYRKIPKELLTGEKWMYKSVSIGDQLSQIIGVYYPHEIDTYVKYVRSQKFYGRYMDDFYIMNPDKDELHDLLNDIYKIADRLGIHINRKKTRIVKISGTYKYLQVKYTLTKNGKIIKRINPRRITVMRRKLKKLSVKVREGNLPYEFVEEMFRSWMGHFYKIMSKQQRKNLIGLFEDLYEKRVEIIKNKMIFHDKPNTCAIEQLDWLSLD